MRNAPHVLTPGLETIFGQPPPNCLVRQAPVFGELDHGTGQKLQRPACAAFWRTGAGRCHQQGFFLGREFALRSKALLFAQRPLQIAFDEAPLGPIHGRAANAHAGRDIIVADAGIGGE